MLGVSASEGESLAAPIYSQVHGRNFEEGKDSQMTTAKKESRLVRLLKAKGACADGIEWAKQHRTASAAWEACDKPDWMLWAIDATGLADSKAMQKKLRLFACWCARNTPLADGRVTWDLLTDERSRKAVEVAERFANGEATREELDAAWAAAWDAARAAAGAAARAAARAAAGDAALDAAWAAAGAAARDAAWAAARAAARDAANSELEQRLERLASPQAAVMIGAAQ
jgi:hypothetical protein